MCIEKVLHQLSAYSLSLAFASDGDSHQVTSLEDGLGLLAAWLDFGILDKKGSIADDALRVNFPSDNYAIDLGCPESAHNCNVVTTLTPECFFVDEDKLGHNFRFIFLCLLDDFDVNV